jgi:hypothetical protein
MDYAWYRQGQAHVKSVGISADGVGGGISTGSVGGGFSTHAKADGVVMEPSAMLTFKPVGLSDITIYASASTLPYAVTNFSAAKFVPANVPLPNSYAAFSLAGGTIGLSTYTKEEAGESLVAIRDAVLAARASEEAYIKDRFGGGNGGSSTANTASNGSGTSTSTTTTSTTTSATDTDTNSNSRNIELATAVRAAVMWNCVWLPTEQGPVLPVDRHWDLAKGEANPDWGYSEYSIVY